MQVKEVEPLQIEKEKDIKMDYEWLIRPCEFYKEEYGDCRSYRARFHQYFISGQSTDCSQWHTDHENCIKYYKDNNIEAGQQVIDSEQRRRMTRLKAHYNNTTWTKRTEPPTDWCKPLPEAITKDYETSYLWIKAKEQKEGLTSGVMDNRTWCSIM